MTLTQLYIQLAAFASPNLGGYGDEQIGVQVGDRVYPVKADLVPMGKPFGPRAVCLVADLSAAETEQENRTGESHE